MRKIIFVICFSLLLIGCTQNNTSTTEQHKQQKIPKKEYIHYKIITNDDKQGSLIKTQAQNIELTLKIIPHISRPNPVLYTLFLNGKQIKIRWDKNEEPSYFFRKTLLPNENSLLKMHIRDLPKGTNTLNFGSVLYPDKYDLPEKDQLSSKYTMDFHPFTIIVGNEDYNSELDFTYNKEIISRDREGIIADAVGALSNQTDKISVKKGAYYIQDTKTLYYYWENTESEPVNVRLSLLLDWKQVPWSPEKLFIDTLTYPGDLIIKDIDLSDIVHNEKSAISVIAFINPGKSFWYFNNETNDIEANHLKGQVFSAIIKSSNLQKVFPRHRGEFFMSPPPNK